VASVNSNISTKAPKDEVSRRVLDKALANLEPDERSSIEDLILSPSESVDAVLKSVINLAEDKQKICESKRWVIQWRGKTVELHKKAESVVKWLDRFKEVGDIIANVDPVHVGLPWAGVRFLLEVRS
jgi:hypothetical protein